MAASTPASAPAIVVKFGGHTDIGNKSENQDEFEAKLRPEGVFLGVYDGHGQNGRKIAVFTKENLPNVLREDPNFKKDIKKAIRNTFLKMQDIVKASGHDIYLSGTTATIALVIGTKLIVANVGDSRAILGREDSKGQVKAVVLTKDHTCEDKSEVERLKKAGARVEPMVHQGAYLGPPRCWKGSMPYPGQCVSRTIGDDVAHSIGVTADPEIKEVDLTPKDKFIVVASDGVWDGLDNQSVVDIVAKHKDPQKASEVVVQEALRGLDKEEIDDNVTAVVALFSKP
eukprot:Opistho-1_new@91130